MDISVPHVLSSHDVLSRFYLSTASHTAHRYMLFSGESSVCERYDLSCYGKFSDIDHRDSWLDCHAGSQHGSSGLPWSSTWSHSDHNDTRFHHVSIGYDIQGSFYILLEKNNEDSQKWEVHAGVFGVSWGLWGLVPCGRTGHSEAQKLPSHLSHSRFGLSSQFWSQSACRGLQEQISDSRHSNILRPRRHVLTRQVNAAHQSQYCH